MKRTDILSVLATASAFALAPDVSAAAPWHRLDQSDVTLVRIHRPEAFALLEKGTDLLARGDVERALVALKEASAEAPRSAVAARKWCEALTAAGRHDEAVAACHQALLLGPSPLVMRAAAAAAMSGQKPPTVEETARAMAFARSARDSLPEEPWGYAAECDVARRLGDRRMLDVCTSELETVAPKHYETERALAMNGATSRGVRLAWLIVLLLHVVTAVDAAFRSRRLLRAAAGAALIVLATSLVARNAAAHAASNGDPQAAADEQPPSLEELKRASRSLSDVEIDPQHPEQSLPSEAERERDPLQFGYLLMDLNDRAAAATRAGDHRAAVRYLEALTKAVPDESLGFTRLCAEYRALGERTQAIQSCAAAIGRHGARVSDFRHYADVILEKKGGLTRKEVEALDAVGAHLKSVPSAGTLGLELDCELGLRDDDVHRLERCVPALERAAPSAPSTATYEWALALLRGDYGGATSAIERARKAGLSLDSLQRMERITTARRPLARTLAGVLALAACAAGLALAGVYAFRRFRVAGLG
ncbi:MAG TPA: hypothetical protein VHC69_00355 [Polyangiaceae bacterium]|nr:hypothetical protein [Polyangiaceae bacterium]